MGLPPRTLAQLSHHRPGETYEGTLAEYRGRPIVGRFECCPDDRPNTPDWEPDPDWVCYLAGGPVLQHVHWSHIGRP